MLEGLCGGMKVCLEGEAEGEVHGGWVGQRAMVTAGSGGVEDTGAECGEREDRQLSSTPGENTEAVGRERKKKEESMKGRRKTY